MSIPPLVCNTPPPPDQCEDDKEEEFDIQYRLSQDDDDDESQSYNYGNFSSYNGQESPENIDKINSDSPKFTNTVQDDKIYEDITKKDSAIIESNMIPKIDDVAIEDLNLKIEEEPVISENITETLNTIHEDDTYGISCIVNHSDSPDKTIHASITNDDEYSSDDKSQSEINAFSLDNPVIPEETTQNYVDVQEVVAVEIEPATDILMTQSSPVSGQVTPKSTDDFDDFDNFQFTTTSMSNEVISIENPWDNNDDTGDFGFGDFKANFESDNNANVEEKVNDTDKDIKESEGNVEDTDFDDDFGDFDDFKSSAKVETDEKSSPDIQTSHSVPVLNFQCPENETQILESINNILFDIFTEEIQCDNVTSERNLESMLSEVWHDLKQVDERQPYIIQWNNSVAQKSLLKALCIDSRNILFGPKWNYSTPKFATCLSVAPLQPQKPTPAPNISTEMASDKAPSKDNTTWSDPFTADGQEYTYAEALLLDLENLMATLDQMAHKQSTLKISDLLCGASSTDKEPPVNPIRPSDLDMFEKAISVTSIDNIHSSTLSVQPLRHINLPDTHIFTPTDSETPRSKTIHYDNGPPVLLPQQVIEPHPAALEQSIPQQVKADNNDEYWEFQDFKGVPENTDPVPPLKDTKQDEDVDTAADNVKSNLPANPAGVTYQSQLLQPVKIEPIMPKLNWPDPGEVKETFEDFSDFVSKTSWSSEVKTDQSVVRIEQVANDNNETTVSGTTFDDDFETFQSAPSVANHVITNHVSDLNTFESFGSQVNAQSQSPLQATKAKDTIVPNQNHTRTTKNSTPAKSLDNFMMNTSLNTHSIILQPVNSNTTRSQQGQILQPLSLESYSHINWPKPGVDLQSLSSFNPLESLEALKSDSGSSGPSKGASPIHKVNAHTDKIDDDIWGDFVSSKPKPQPSKKTPVFADDDEWTDFVSSPSVNTISFNVQSNSSLQKGSNLNSAKNNQSLPLDIPTLNYITPKSSNRGAYIDKHFQNL